MRKHSQVPRKRLCWRHHLDLASAAFGGLLDLSGKSYLRWSKRILTEARTCARCQALNARQRYQ